jgi:uncharacterized membrane protein
MSLRSRLLLFLSLAGLSINVLLLWWKLADAAIAGCGGGGGCNDVLASRWSQVLGLPVPVLGVLVYLVLPWSILRRKDFIAAFCYSAIAGSAVWLIIVQAVLLRHFCPWCMAAHAVGISLAVIGIFSGGVSGRGLLTGIAAAFGLALVQLIGPTPATHRIESDLNAAASGTGGIHAQGTGRKISFDGGRKTYDSSSLPRLGSVDAKHVMVEYLDYQCPACRKMSGYLAALIEKHPADLCVLLLPVPLDHRCNSALAAGDAGHPGSCELTQIALAVWRANPAAFPDIHRALLADPTPDKAAAMAIAVKHVPPPQLEAAMRDPWIEQLIQADIADWVSFSRKTKQLPKLLIRDQRILHGLPSGEADFIRVMEQELGF